MTMWRCSIRRRKVDGFVDYWGLVEAAHALVPTVVEQCVDMREREGCRTYLANAVDQAMEESKSLDLADDVNDSQYWHDQYSSISEACEDYVKLFPDDPEIPRVDELSQVVEEYPRLDYDPDEDEDFLSRRSYSSSSDGASSDGDIQQIFSDL